MKPSVNSVEWAADRLWSAFGPPAARREVAVLDGLIETILSQNTTNHNSSLAMDRYRTAFGSHAAALEAGVEAIEAAIRPAGLAPTRASRIHALLRRLAAEHGDPTLEFLRHWSDDAARCYLAGLVGVGPKTAACVLLFVLGRAEFPVDTHVRRIAAQLGWIAVGCSAEAAHPLLREAVPEALRYGLHVHLVRLGREVCRPRAPRCGTCPLANGCGTFAAEGQSATAT